MLQSLTIRIANDAFKMYVKRADRLSQLHVLGADKFHGNLAASSSTTFLPHSGSSTVSALGGANGVASVNATVALQAPVVQHIRSSTWRTGGTAAAKCSVGAGQLAVAAGTASTAAGNVNGSCSTSSSFSSSSLLPTVAPSRNEPHPLIAAAAAAAATSSLNLLQRKGRRIEVDNEAEDSGTEDEDLVPTQDGGTIEKHHASSIALNSVGGFSHLRTRSARD